MESPNGWSHLKDITASQAVGAIDVLARDYMMFFGVQHVTPHIMRCLLEVVCPCATDEVKNVALEKIADLRTIALPKHAAEALRALLCIADISAKDALSRCSEESHRLCAQMLLRRQPVASARRVLSERLKDAEGVELRAVKELQDSRSLLHAYEQRFQEMEDELHRVRPEYGWSDKVYSSRVGELVDGARTLVRWDKSPNSAQSSTTGRLSGQGNLVMEGVSVNSNNMTAAIAYRPSRDFVLQAARQLFAESLVSASSNDGGHPNHHHKQMRPPQQPYAECGTAPLAVPTPKDGSTRHMNTSFSEFSLTTAATTTARAEFLPFVCHTLGSEQCDTIPPTMEAISAEAFHTLMADNRPLRVQQEEREARLRAWAPLGKGRLSYSEAPNGPAAYTRQTGVHHLVKMEQQMTQLLLLK